METIKKIIKIALVKQIIVIYLNKDALAKAQAIYQAKQVNIEMAFLSIYQETSDVNMAMLMKNFKMVGYQKMKKQNLVRKIKMLSGYFIMDLNVK